MSENVGIGFFFWDFGECSGGVLPFLCPADMLLLKNEVIDAFEAGAPMDANDVIDFSCKLKGERIAKGCKMLSLLGCYELETSISEEVKSPVRSWVNNILDDLECKLKNRRFIDPKRIEACSTDVIRNFIVSYSALFNSTYPFFIFGADETMIQSKSQMKILVPGETTNQVIEAQVPDMPHMSGMMCHNVSGVSLPPFIILSDLKRLPDELKLFVLSNQIWVCSTSTGYMNRDAFVLWTLCFVTWLSEYRLHFPENIRNAQVLLIMDGHSSRECPLALFLLRKANVKVLILPSHVTHVLQMFDRVLASVLKSHFGTAYRKLLKQPVAEASALAHARACAVQAFIDAWRIASTPSNCLAAAKAVGVYPYDPEAAIKSPFVRELTTEENARYQARLARLNARMNISSQIITEATKIVEIRDSIKDNQRFQHLCQIESYLRMTFSQITHQFLQHPKNDTYLLSKIPPMYQEDKLPVII